MKFKAADFVIFAIFLIVTSVFCIFIFKNISGNKKQLVISNGSDEWIYPLSKNERLEIPGKLGNSIILIEDNCAYFEDSPCDNKLCIYSHKISKVGEWTACLPNGVIIRIDGTKKTENNEIDAWTE
ncbi:MAG: NusG domain II-containing protein [Treponemataceae bacterium]|nr:NusG domain II-containing protein [Treponemataceae bacterium]